MKRCAVVLMAAVLHLSLMVEAATIFYDDFDGIGTADLNGTTPDVTSGDATWVASSDFKADGFADATAGGSATLAFTPVNGKIYTLDCSLSGVAGDADWFALGFASGQSTTKGNNDRFITGNVIAKAWMFIRGSDGGNYSWRGNDASGTGDNAEWTTYANQAGGDILMRIVLNTTGGAGTWTATWYVKRPADSDYSVVRTTAGMLTESISSVGFAIANPTVQGTIESFTLSEGIPIGWSIENTSAISTDSAFVSATVDTNVTETVLVWDTSDKGVASTNDWTYRKALGPWSAGVVSGVISNLTADSQYTWRLYGANTLIDILTDSWSDAVTFGTSLTDAQKPVFTNAEALSPNIIKLDWQDNASTETGYVVQRSTTEGSGYTTVAFLGADVNSYTDNVGVAESSVYYYQLAATNTTNSSGTDPTLCRTNAATGAWSGRGALRGPYKVDANTLHLWHMDENDPAPAQAAPGLAGSFELIPTNGAVMGAPAYTGFGTAGDASAATTNGFQGSSIPVSSVTGADGAFTFEAIINVANVVDIQQIVAMDNNGEIPDDPSSSGSTGIREMEPRHGRYPVHQYWGPSIQTFIAPIPTSGDHAFVPDQWFHVAVTYNGSENTPDNIKFFWTRMDARPFQANEILSASMIYGLAGVDTILGVGNEFRGSPDNNIEGRIDEVRISNIARAPDQMMFYTIPGTTFVIY